MTAVLSMDKIATVPLGDLVLGDSPRLEGADEQHIALLAEIEEPLPPILIDRKSMRIIDGVHRFMAASLKGQESIEVEFFDGSDADAFVRAVEANVQHGLPLTRADRWAAAARILASHSQMSDRAIAEATGLPARRVASIRQDSTAEPGVETRTGRDGKIRPLSSSEGRQRAAAAIAENPRASLREVAKIAGVSPGTVRDVRKRLDRGDEPTLPKRVHAHSAARALENMKQPLPRPRQEVRGLSPSPASLVDKLMRDPSLRHTERGRSLLRLLQHDAAKLPELPHLMSTVPLHCTPLLVELALQHAQAWSDFAHGLEQQCV
jgi:ParB-like chromosome segregation protein Spo0J